MLKIDIPETDGFDPNRNEFVTIKGQSLTLEHSLVSISKWESKWHIPYLSPKQKTTEQVYDYIKCMTLTQNVNPDVYFCIPQTEMAKINEYIEDKMTATWFSEEEETKKKTPFGEVITSEIIYYWMISLGIPMECQKWHLNRLLTLIRVCGEKNKPAQKRSKKEIMDRNRKLNEARRKQHRTKG